ncbi:malto-oligosyltrehalose synthase [Rhodococcus sp. NPDC058521]|uniref:malto-oligosyltrehalose synthase n=1 Tax=Rhodococcus sp. NPDC058521 TaxID=3346536 RepID=UPI003666B2AB
MDTTAPEITSTYRLQLRGDGFGFAQAAELLDYFHDLGVSHLYLSPILTATTGSTHGYDVTDPTTVSEALGGREQFVDLSRSARDRGMGLVVDIVPNHLGIAVAQENAWWWDVLTHGRDSEFARFFDIDWRADNGADGAIAIPVLGSALDVSALWIDRGGDQPRLAFHDHRFPLAPGTDGRDVRAVHEAQHYRLFPWNAGVVGYRRFFGVDTLAAVRQEDPVVFEATHRELTTWVEEDLVDGVRVDHPDGMADPRGYLIRLRRIIGPNRLLLVEKILGSEEPLDATLPVDGTTGYDALTALGAVFVDARGAAGLATLARRRTGEPGDATNLDEQGRELKRTVAAQEFPHEMRRLARAVERESSMSTDREELTRALVELVARIPVYRTDYAPLRGILPRTLDALSVELPSLRRSWDAVTVALAAQGEAAVRLQQICGAVTAKAIEDCLFYRTARLVSSQEVGGDPGRFGMSPTEFHLVSADRARNWPRTMTTLCTHDTKRGEDVRARIGVLSQVPDLWARCVEDWENRTPSPDPAAGLFLWQNLFGVWPHRGPVDLGLRSRLHAYAEKAVRESGTRTTWTNVDTEFEAQLHEWLDAVIDGPVGSSLGELTHQLAPHAWSDSLGQKLLQLCGPGIPDLYQGTERWEDSLVDPDNRRFVDFDRLRTGHPEPSPPPLDDSGRAKQHVVRQSLRLRRSEPESFVHGAYTPVFADGSRSEHVLGFGRGPSDKPLRVLALATRLSVTLEDTGWEDTTVNLPAGGWLDTLTDRSHSGSVRVGELFDRYPVSLLHRNT